MDVICIWKDHIISLFMAALKSVDLDEEGRSSSLSSGLETTSWFYSSYLFPHDLFLT